jgi:hypothetical protein
MDIEFVWVFEIANTEPVVIVWEIRCWGGEEYSSPPEYLAHHQQDLLTAARYRGLRQSRLVRHKEGICHPIAILTEVTHTDILPSLNIPISGPRAGVRISTIW